MSDHWELSDGVNLGTEVYAIASTSSQRCVDVIASAAGTAWPGIYGADVLAASAGAVRYNTLPAYSRNHRRDGPRSTNDDLCRFNADGEDALQTSAVVWLESRYYKRGSFGLGVEDTFIISDIGAERVPRSPEELPFISL